MKKLPIYVSLDFLIKFYAEMDELKKKEDEDLLILALSFSKLISNGQLYYSKSDNRGNFLKIESNPRLKNILRNARNDKDYDKSVLSIENLKETIEKSLISYIFHRTIDQANFENLDFSEYCRLLSNKPLLNSIVEKARKFGHDVFKDNPDKLTLIITEEFNALVSL